MKPTAQQVLPRKAVTSHGASPEPTAVAYVMNGFPRLSETFITHEIHQLEQMGMALRLFSVKREDEDKVHPVVAAIRAPLTYLPKATSLSGASLVTWVSGNLPAFWRANLAVAWRHPLRYVRTAASALALSWRYRPRDEGTVRRESEVTSVLTRPAGVRLRKVFIKELIQAGWVADAVERSGDVRHLHGHFCHGVATITWFASRMTGIPFSFTAHAKDIYQAELNPGTLLERKLGAARFVATCTCANADVLRQRHPRPQEVHAVYHGLDTDYFSPSPARGTPTDAVPTILAVGRFVEKKGFDHLIEACAQLRQQGVRFRCLIVGEPGSASDGIRRLVARHALGENVQLQGAVAQDALREIYRSAHVFALPCQVMEDGDRDGFPNVLAEAMAMGVPVVSTAISGIPEMIDDGVHGLLVAPRDSRALAGALQRVLTDAGLHARMSHAGRQRICERFDSRRTTQALRDLFLEQLRQRREARA